MHTPKLVEMFLRDRLNQIVLFTMSLGAANVLFVDNLIGPKFAPVWAFRVAVYGALVGWALLVPYFFYVVQFLDPSNILARLKHETVRIVEAAAAGRVDLDLAQDQVHERVHQIGTIILKSLDRADRGVAGEGIWTLKQLLDHYGARKNQMPDAWFVVDRKDFVGASQGALDILNEDRTWYEAKVLTQMFLAYQSALAKTADVVASISDANRVVAVHAAARHDDKALALGVRFFNSFLREAIKRKDVHSIYDVFYQYRLLARDVHDQPVLLRAIAGHFRYYSDQARAAGLAFVPQLAAMDMGYMVRRCYEFASPAAHDLLGMTLALSHREKGELLRVLLKAKIILGGFFLEKGLAAEAEEVRLNIADVAPAAIDTATRELLAAERTYWEVTDRQMNLEYIAPERREHVRAFAASLTGTG